MTPKVKAKELIDKFTSLDTNIDGFDLCYHNSRDCALITVDEIINVLKEHGQPLEHPSIGLWWWKLVKKEIELL